MLMSDAIGGLVKALGFGADRFWGCNACCPTGQLGKFRRNSSNGNSILDVCDVRGADRLSDIA